MADVFAELRAALPAAHQLSLDQARLQGRVDQAVIDRLSTDPRLVVLAALLDKLNGALDEARPFIDALPDPWKTIFGDVAAAVRVADKSISPLGL
jgi:hypothetical protein